MFSLMLIFAFIIMFLIATSPYGLITNNGLWQCRKNVPNDSQSYLKTIIVRSKTVKKATEYATAIVAVIHLCFPIIMFSRQSIKTRSSPSSKSPCRPQPETRRDARACMFKLLHRLYDETIIMCTCVRLFKQF